MIIDKQEVYEVQGLPGTFVALRAINTSDGLVFHDTTRTRIITSKRVKLIPLTLDRWNKLASKKFNPQAPKFDTREKLVSALKRAIRA